MARKCHNAEEIIGKLREAEVGLASGRGAAEMCRVLGVTEQTYYRWRNEYGGVKLDQAKRMKELERENARLRRAVSDLTLDKLILASPPPTRPPAGGRLFPSVQCRFGQRYGSAGGAHFRGRTAEVESNARASRACPWEVFPHGASPLDSQRARIRQLANPNLGVVSCATCETTRSWNSTIAGFAFSIPTSWSTLQGSIPSGNVPDPAALVRVTGRDAVRRDHGGAPERYGVDTRSVRG